MNAARVCHTLAKTGFLLTSVFGTSYHEVSFVLNFSHSPSIEIYTLEQTYNLIIQAKQSTGHRETHMKAHSRLCLRCLPTSFLL